MKKEFRPTVRIVADVAPSTKEKLQDVATSRGETMAQFLTNAIEKEHKKIFKNDKSQAVK